jgi:transcriptional regulator with XRE-family HTH domain
MTLKRRVGHRIRLARKRRGLSQEELAERVERSTEAISSIERGIALPNFLTLERLARALDVPVREFFDIGPESARDNPRRSRIVVELVEAASSLNDADLELALEQVQALARKRAGRKR